MKIVEARVAADLEQRASEVAIGAPSDMHAASQPRAVGDACLQRPATPEGSTWGSIRQQACCMLSCCDGPDGSQVLAMSHS